MRDVVPDLSEYSLSQFNAEKDAFLAKFETHIYGNYPADLFFELRRKQDIKGYHYNGSAKLSVLHFNIGLSSDIVDETFRVVMVEPAQSTGAEPVIMIQNFCPNHDVIDHPDIPKPEKIDFSCSGNKFASKATHVVFGRYIMTPPIEELMRNGYALAIMFPSEFVPDNAEAGKKTLEDFFSPSREHIDTGAISAWAGLFVQTGRWLDSNTNYNTFIAYGHSRYGKSALWAAANDPIISGVLSHQSGTGGASLTRNKKGETASDITQSYPHWFTSNYANFDLDDTGIYIDQHILLAMIAPRAVLLGNAMRDVWSDPEGAFVAAKEASHLYELYGADGLSAERLNDFEPSSNLSYWIRPGTHGVVKEDWEAFIEFLNAHFKP